MLFGSAKILAEKGIRRRICLQDATVVTCASNKSSYFRLHTEYVPGQGLAYVQITDQRGAESLKYGQYQPGDIVIADQGLARARDFHHVHSTGAYSLIRAYLPNIRLLDAQDKRVVANNVLNMVDAGIHSIPVWIPFERNTPLAARLVVKKLPPEQAARARVRAKKRMSKSQKGGSDLAIRLAGYVVLLTTVPESDLSDEQLLKTYQLRWQIELFFKRCKSLLGLDELRAGGRVAHSWLLGKMLIAALIDRKLVQLLQETNGGTPSNLWRLTALCLKELTDSIAAVENEPLLVNTKALRHLKEPRRKRVDAGPQINALYARLNPHLK